MICKFSVLLWSKPFTFKLKFWIWTKPACNANFIFTIPSFSSADCIFACHLSLVVLQARCTLFFAFCLDINPIKEVLAGGGITKTHFPGSHYIWMRLKWKFFHSQKISTKQIVDQKVFDQEMSTIKTCFGDSILLPQKLQKLSFLRGNFKETM